MSKVISTTVKTTPKKGRGVFANTDINKGQLIESCELILLDEADVGVTLEGYIYQYTKSKLALALGNGSLYNHSDDSNSEFYFDHAKKLLSGRALKNIKAGTEITLNYGYTESDKKRFKIKDE